MFLLLAVLLSSHFSSAQDSDSDGDDEPRAAKTKVHKMSIDSTDDDVMVSDASMADDCPLVDVKSPTSPLSPEALITNKQTTGPSSRTKSKRLSSSGSTGSTHNKYSKSAHSTVIHDGDKSFLAQPSPNSTFSMALKSSGASPTSNPPPYLPALHMLSGSPLAPSQSFSAQCRLSPQTVQAYSQQQMSLPGNGYNPYGAAAGNPSLYGSNSSLQYHDVHLGLSPSNPPHAGQSLDNSAFTMAAMHHPLTRAGQSQSFISQAHLFSDMARMSAPSSTNPVVSSDPRGMLTFGGPAMM